MSLSRRRPTPSPAPDQAVSREDLGLAEELAKQQLSELHKLRQHYRLEVRLGVVLRPGNLSEGDAPSATGSTLDLSVGGCCARLDRAPTPGDLYRLDLSAESRSIPTVHAQCVRASLVDGKSFEAGFHFLTPLDADELERASDADLLD